MEEMNKAVTKERFAAGLTYKDYIAQIKVNKEQFEKYYATAQLSDSDKMFFGKAAGVSNGSAKMLVLGEDWCPDVFRGMPIMARIGEASGIEVRIFPRDQNLDIMNEFLNQGKFMSLPVVVFYTKDLRYICHWIERPALANQERAKIEQDVKKEKPGASEQEIKTMVGERTRIKYPAWQQESVKEIREMLAKKLSL